MIKSTLPNTKSTDPKIVTRSAKRIDLLNLLTWLRTKKSLVIMLSSHQFLETIDIEEIPFGDSRAILIYLLPKLTLRLLKPRIQFSIEF